MEHISFEPIFANSVSLVAIQLPMLRPLKKKHLLTMRARKKSKTTYKTKKRFSSKRNR